MEATAQIIEEKQTAIENGEGDALAAQELSDAAMAYAKAKKDYAEQTAMAEHRKDDADTAIDRRVQDARQEARQAIRREQEAAREALSEDRQARAARIDSELEALNAQDEALQNEFTEALSGLSDAQEMGMDEDTIAQLMARTDEIAERMAALEEARERLSNPEAYSTQEEAAQTEPTEQDTQTEQAAQNGQAAQTEQIVQSAPQNCADRGNRADGRQPIQRGHGRTGSGTERRGRGRTEKPGIPEIRERDLQKPRHGNRRRQPDGRREERLRPANEPAVHFQQAGHGHGDARGAGTRADAQRGGERRL